MNSHVTLQERLKDLRVERKLSLKELAEETGISSSALGEYENDDKKGIPHYVLTTLAKYYGVSLDYLFDLSHVRENTNTDIKELGLDDKTIDILKSNEINNRLLCEIICHPGFKKLMADTEIYVDGIASQFIQSLNSFADVMSKKIVNEYNPGENDPGLLVLDACKVEEDRYFLDKLQLDMEPIVKDIREAHVDDKETATDTTVADRVNEVFDIVKKHTNSAGKLNFLELLIEKFALEVGVSPNAMSPHEIETLHGIFIRSKKYKQLMNQIKNAKLKKRK